MLTTGQAGPAEILANPPAYMERALKIRTKTGDIVPFELNPVQIKLCRLKQAALDAGKAARFLILKSRRVGITTFEQGMNFHTVATQFNQQVVTLAHESESTEKIFRISNLFYDTLDPQLRPRRLAPHNKRNLHFPGLNSYFDIGTAGSKGFGRGDTLNRVHGSEVAWWPRSRTEQDQLLAGLDKACSHGEVVLESTPNGVGGLFHDLWQEAKDGHSIWTAIFLPWWTDPTNRVHLNEDQVTDIRKSLSDEEKALIKKHDLDYMQIGWRRAEQIRLKSLFMQEQPEDDITCFLVSGVHWFDLTIVRGLVPQCEDPIEVRENGHLKIWKKPEAGHRYIAGVDASEGLPTSDPGGVGVLDRTTCEQVAEFHGRVRPEVLAKKAVKLCREYNRALLAIEANNHGHSVLNSAKNTEKYGNLFYHRQYDVTGTEKLGWQTNDKTRPMLLDGLKTAVEDRLMKINDRGFLSECMTFQRDPDGNKYEARPGKHDDRVIKWGIAWAVRSAPARTPRVTAL